MNTLVDFGNFLQEENKTIFSIFSREEYRTIEDDHTPIGEISIRERQNGYLEIGSIEIDAEFQHNGMATEAIAQTIAMAIAYGYRKFRVSTNNPYLSAVMLNKFGFNLRVGHTFRNHRPIHVWEAEVGPDVEAMVYANHHGVAEIFA